MSRSRYRTALLTALVWGVAALLVAGCGGAAKKTSTAGSATLRVPFLTDISVPDPDVFYDTEGNSVITSLYEGLLRYAPDSTRIAPALATSWSVSSDRKTYTFKLRPGVTFHDGTPFTSASVRASLTRRRQVNGAPSYMVAEVQQVATPDAHTAVIHLKQPVGPFLHYLASSWGPKMIGPDALKTHAGRDFGQKWLARHDDGTGPYVLAALDRGRQYVLTSYAAYWGAKPYFSKVLIKIEPDVNLQRTELQNGDLDAILHAFPVSELGSLGGGVKIQQKPTLLRTLLYLNTHEAPFDALAARRAVAQALDVGAIVKQVYARTASVATGPYQPQILRGQPQVSYPADGASAKALVARAGGPAKVTLGYSADEPVNGRTGQLIQAQLAAIGYAVTLKPVPVSQLYNYIDKPKQGPDMLLGTYAPDAAHPDAWARIVWRTGGGLDLLGYSDPKLDAMIDRASLQPPAAADAAYRAIGRRVDDSYAFLPLANVDDVFLLRKDLKPGAHFPPYPWLLDYATASR